MPINFPDNPTDNQEFNGYIYDATRGVWDVKLASDPLGTINITTPVEGESLVFDGTNWVNQEVATPASAKTIDSDSIAVDFSDGIPLERRSVAGDVTFTASNYTAGVTKKIFLNNKDSRSELTFPAGWNFIESDKPTALGPDRKNVLELTSFGTTEADVVATWLGPSAFEPIVAYGGTETTIDINNVTYKIHTFTASEPFDVQSTGTIGTVEYLVVGGGGNGGGHSGGGGGAGGLRSSIQGYASGGNSSAENIVSLVESIYAIEVGAGAAPKTASTGSYSKFSNITALGGGSGGGRNENDSWQNAVGGGSGGGATWQYSTSNGVGGSGTANQGFAGGSCNFPNGAEHPSAGGGGASALGASPPNNSSNGGNGGGGILVNADGFNYYYAGGGGGAVHYTTVVAGDGGAGGGGGGGAEPTSNCGSGDTSGRNNGGSPIGLSTGGNGGANTGGGGGGGSQDGATNGAGGAGGSGIVIIRYPITDPN